MKNNICPLTLCGGSEKTAVNCLGTKCAWWVEVYTTEGIPTCLCALVMIACKTSEGLLRI